MQLCARVPQCKNEPLDTAHRYWRSKGRRYWSFFRAKTILWNYVLDSGKVYKGGNLVDINKKNDGCCLLCWWCNSYGAQTSYRSNKVFAYSITSDGKIKLTQAFANYTGKAFDGGPDASNTTGLVSVGYNKSSRSIQPMEQEITCLLTTLLSSISKISATSWKENYGKGDFDANITSALSSAIYLQIDRRL